MGTFSLYNPLSRWKKGDNPVPPIVHLALGIYSESEGKILLGPDLMTDKEVDDLVDLLLGELEKFCEQAKKELRSLREKMKASLP